MRNIYLLLLVCTINFCLAQNIISNADFSTPWPSSPGQPNGWTDSRDISQVSPGYDGAGWAAQGYKTASNDPIFKTSSADNGIYLQTIHNYFNLYYKFASDSSDILNVNVTVRNSFKMLVGTGNVMITNPAADFTLLTVPISYSGFNPVDVIITIAMRATVSGGTPHVTSNFVIDNLSLTHIPLAAETFERESSRLQVIPNPAKEFVQIRNPALGAKTATVEITNILGQVVREMKEVDFSVSGPRINVSDLQPGNYILTVKQDEFIQTKRLVIE